jgi:hypothetical protein
MKEILGVWQDYSNFMPKNCGFFGFYIMASFRMPQFCPQGILCHTQFLLAPENGRRHR